MRPGGREIQAVQTHAPGQLEFLPNQPTQRRRQLDAEHMAMTYGPENQLQSFRAINVQTETEPNAEERTRKQAVSKTRSKNMSAEFDPTTGQMKRMEQWDDFAYEDGDRRARANRAIMERTATVMTLETAARVWDATGATSADRIRIDQKTGDFAADGHVSSSRQPDKKNFAVGMLAGDQPVEAMADRMTRRNHNRLLHYEGHVVMWQGGDRITAERDRHRSRQAHAERGGRCSYAVSGEEAKRRRAAGGTGRSRHGAAAAGVALGEVPNRESQIRADLQRPGATASFVIVKAAIWSIPIRTGWRITPAASC